MTEPQRPQMTFATGGNAAPVEEWRVQLANIERQVTDCLMAGQRGDWEAMTRAVAAMRYCTDLIEEWIARRTGTGR